MVSTALTSLIIAILTVLGDAPEGGVVDWMRQEATPIDGVEPGTRHADLAVMKTWFQPARVIGLGEATQGSREFFRLKHKLVEFLVAECGVTTIALEASWPETLALDHWMQGGDGDPRELLADLHFWNHNTEEMLAFVNALRAANAGGSRRVRLVGIDMQLPAGAVLGAAEFLDHVAPADSERFRVATSPFAELDAYVSYPRLAPAEQATVRAGLDDFARAFERHRERWSAATSEADYALARRALEQVRRAERAFSTPADHDRMLAENVRDLVEDDGVAGRVVVWSHNVHVAAALPGAPSPPAGAFLREWFGAKYLAVGFEFHRGAFLAVGSSPDGGPALREFTLGAPPFGSAPAILDQVGKGVFALDLRSAPAGGPVRGWLDSPTRTHSIGGMFDAARPEAAYLDAPLGEQFDVVFFVRRVLVARPL